jgi:hypothetical protein
LRLRKTSSLAVCTGLLGDLSESAREQAQCAKSNQRLLGEP